MDISKIGIGEAPPHDVNVLIEIQQGACRSSIKRGKASGAQRFDRRLHTAMFDPRNDGCTVTRSRVTSIRSISSWSARDRVRSPGAIMPLTAGRRHADEGRGPGGTRRFSPIQHDELHPSCSDVERNALRAGLVDDAVAWPWGSLAWRAGSERKTLLADCPVKLPDDWIRWVNAPQTATELAELRACVNRQRPYGTEQWVDRTAAELGLQSSLRPAGRPFRDRGK